MKNTTKNINCDATHNLAAHSLSSSDIYLISYNALQFLGWCIVLMQTVYYIIMNSIHTHDLWKGTSVCLKIFQTLAVLEIVHVSIGIVRSNVVTASVQIFSRVFIVWPICNSVPASQLSTGLPLILIAWSITEIIRYSFYFLNIMKMAPDILIYLRYTLFIVLYPVGAFGEQLCIFAALPDIAKQRLYTISLPNTFNFTFEFYYICILLLILYIPIFPRLYFYMFSQRRKTLGKDTVASSDKKKAE